MWYYIVMCPFSKSDVMSHYLLRKKKKLVSQSLANLDNIIFQEYSHVITILQKFTNAIFRTKLW